MQETCHPRGDLRGSSESLASTHDLKRKVCEAQENVLSHRERTRRFSNEHTRTEALVSDALNSHMPCKLRPKQRALCVHHTGSVKYLREATKVMEDWQRQLEDGQPAEE